MAAPARKDSGKTEKAATGGFGKKAGSKAAPVVDAATLLRQSMELYDRISTTPHVVNDASIDSDEDDEAPEFKEYVVCVRLSSEPQV